MLVDSSIWITSENALVVHTISSKEVLNTPFLIILLYFQFDLNCFRINMKISTFNHERKFINIDTTSWNTFDWLSLCIKEWKFFTKVVTYLEYSSPISNTRHLSRILVTYLGHSSSISDTFIYNTGKVECAFDF